MAAVVGATVVPGAAIRTELKDALRTLQEEGGGLGQTQWQELRRWLSQPAEDLEYHPVASAAVRPRAAPELPSRDWHSEVTVVLLLTCAVLATVASVAAYGYRLQDRKNSMSARPFIGAATVPWALLAAWLLRVACRNFWHPVLESFVGGHWQCNAMVWYLILAPVLTGLNVWAQVSGLLGRLEPTGPREAPMGRIGLPTTSRLPRTDAAAAPAGPWPSRLQLSLLATKVAVLIFGIGIVFFSGHNYGVCQPEVWWSAAALATLTATVIGLLMTAALVALCAIKLLQHPAVGQMLASLGFDRGWSAEAHDLEVELDHRMSLYAHAVQVPLPVSPGMKDPRVPAPGTHAPL